MFIPATLIFGGDSPLGCAIADRFYGAGNAVVLSGEDPDVLSASHRHMHRTDWVRPVVAPIRDNDGGAKAAAVALENYGAVTRVVSLVRTGEGEEASAAFGNDPFAEARGAAKSVGADCPIVFVMVSGVEEENLLLSGSLGSLIADGENGASGEAHEHILNMTEQEEPDEIARVADRVFRFCQSLAAKLEPPSEATAPRMA